jgi:hypothetical protein
MSDRPAPAPAHAQREREAVLEQVRALVREVRDSSLWFLDAEFLPMREEDALRALRWIERRADRQTYVRARELREWLLRTSNAASAGS